MPRAGNDSGGGQPGRILKCKGWETAPNAYIYFITQAPVWEKICDVIGEPGAFEPAANLARTLAQDGRKDDRIRKLLEQVARTDPRPEWAAWAHELLAAMPKPEMSLPGPN